MVPKPVLAVVSKIREVNVPKELRDDMVWAV